MGSLLEVFLVCACAAGSLCIYAVWHFIVRPMFSPINKLPGPPANSFIYGHAFEAHIGDSYALWKKWEEEYGHAMLGIGPLGTRYAVLMDLKAVKDIITRPVDFVKPYQARVTLSRAIGHGVVVAEGEAHKRQRKVLNICFYPATIKNLTPIFHEQSYELRDVLFNMIDDSKDGKPVVDVYKVFLAAVLNVIGLAGFNYRFNAHQYETNPDELEAALKCIYQFDPKSIYRSLLGLAFPDIYRIPGKRLTRHRAGHQTFERIISGLIKQRKKEMYESDSLADKLTFVGGEKKADLKGRDLLTALVRANADPSIPYDQRLTDEEVLAQVKTFLVVGHESTATQLAWLAYELACNPSVQSKVRQEIAEFSASNSSDDEATSDDINSLPYLDAVVREIMRLRPAVPYTMRVAQKDDVIPLANGYTNRDGKWCESLHVQKGDNILIPIEGMNRSVELWGLDANEFKPERWAGGLDTGIPGVWGSMMTFLGGPRSCIGYRLSIYEIKAFIFNLIPVLEFELSVAADDIAGMTCISKRPYVQSEVEKGFQLPIRIKRHIPADHTHD